MKKINYLLGVMAAFCFEATAVDSVKLIDVILRGYGEIDLFKAQVQDRNLSADDLESLRLNHSENLVFAVDVNEAASGTEKASSQGVTVESAYLEFTIAGNKHTFSDFFTQTTTLVAPAEQTQRSSYYTLIGETGSSRITASTNSDINNSSFDSTLTIPVNIDISEASSAVLIVKFLETNVSLGDPEAFYDYSGGFEDVAIISGEDNSYLNQLAIGVDEAPLVVAVSQVTNEIDGWLFYPSSTSYYVVSYEDQYPQTGDYDFNDLIVGYRVGFGMSGSKIVSAVATGYLIARGAEYTHDWYLGLPFGSDVSGSGTLNIFEPDSTTQIDGYPKDIAFTNEINLRVFGDTKSLMSNDGQPFVNTLADQPLVKGHKFSFDLNFDNPVDAANKPGAPFDPFLYTQATGYELHLPGNNTKLSFSSNSGSSDTEYKDDRGYPYALVFTDDWQPPLERVDLGDAYQDFLNYVNSTGEIHQNWFLSPTNEKVKQIGKEFWQW